MAKGGSSFDSERLKDIKRPTRDLKGIDSFARIKSDWFFQKPTVSAVVAVAQRYESPTRIRSEEEPRNSKELIEPEEEMSDKMIR